MALPGKTQIENMLNGVNNDSNMSEIYAAISSRLSGKSLRGGQIVVEIQAAFNDVSWYPHCAHRINLNMRQYLVAIISDKTVLKDAIKFWEEVVPDFLE